MSHASPGSDRFVPGTNLDPKVVSDFGDEWSRFDQTAISEVELRELFDGYFRIFPWDAIPEDAEGFDLGCGTGRWARFVAPRVGTLHCIDPSRALAIARRNLAEFDNCVFHADSVDDISLEDESMDFGYSLGVLHHVPDTAAGLASCVRKLKPGAPFLLYLYYAFDNRPPWFRSIWRASNLVRRVVSRLPSRPKQWFADTMAVAVYFPAARTAAMLERLEIDVDAFPLSAYRGKSFYTMRTDALDRFGTRLEQRFTASQIEAMMQDAGLERVTFSDQTPYWCALGYKR